ncbi:hypothetical protein BMJ34_09125 [Sinorhizobium medicae]|uniref:Fructose-bisphosphate aldolase n=1 Tax=Sinorhizobium medicae TaxID=110321 RepID=A0ABX4TCA1_9HYPH|nr:aldolase [Sinorhizobium medicae]PLT91075.1 hypothetical protein BMJ33_35825 [Sinorhizobium medicae]PLU03552.1 hypothetical protein BMJ34_09125 [Sinorhizobium medicae]PLU18766.1 hypothetical protein BMJ30_12190 [Sinorhizobium medicae]PLU24435.1 hypothetical protein BMJ29_02510 [Sinorhizobium medicae]PLU28376.1 hypothetical protein BMJ27_30110 [Sinorhizobium medicae]
MDSTAVCGHSVGKRNRWSRFVDRPSGRSLLLAVDHGLTRGPLAGLESIHGMGAWIDHPSINGIIAHKGTMARLADARALGAAGLMLHVNGMPSFAEQSDTKETLTTIETALRLGCDAVSLQLNFRRDNAAHNLKMLGRVIDETAAWGLPVLGMIYDNDQTAPDQRLARMRHLVRIACELGLDAIKIEAPPSAEDMQPLLDGLVDDISIFFSGGPSGNLDQLLTVASRAVALGAAGMCVGRNVFQHPDKNNALRLLHNAVCGAGVTDFQQTRQA